MFTKTVKWLIKAGLFVFLGMSILVVQECVCCSLNTAQGQNKSWVPSCIPFAAELLAMLSGNLQLSSADKVKQIHVVRPWSFVCLVWIFVGLFDPMHSKCNHKTHVWIAVFSISCTGFFNHQFGFQMKTDCISCLQACLLQDAHLSQCIQH